MGCLKLPEDGYSKFFYKNIAYLIDKRKLDFTLSILKEDKERFFEIQNLRKFLCKHELLSEEFLEFISVMHQKVEP